MGEQKEQSNSTQLGPWHSMIVTLSPLSTVAARRSTQLGPWYSIMVTLSPLSAVAARADMEWRKVTSVASSVTRTSTDSPYTLRLSSKLGTESTSPSSCSLMTTVGSEGPRDS